MDSAPRARGDGAVRRRTPATLASLAAALGISRTTVSNAYNRPEQLSAPLRERILDAARDLGYPGPDPVARSLRTRRSGSIGLVLAEKVSYAVRDPVAVSFLEGLASACDEFRTALMLVPANPDSEDVAAVSAAAVDGYVVFAMADDDPHLAAVLARSVPAVVCDQPDLPGIDMVGIDDTAAMVEVARHLLHLGHRRIGVACLRLGRRHRDGPVPLERQLRAPYHVQRNRLAGLRTTLVDAGVAWDRIPVVERFDNTVAAGASAAAELLTLDPGLTAVVATSDVLALGVLEELARRHRRVPQDISVVGFDGTRDALARGLTTVYQPFVEKGRRAGELLLERTDNRLDRNHRLEGRRIVLPAEFRPGTTTGAPQM
jgi:DNA-binding LacI/PurR family transcriptional regulator